MSLKNFISKNWEKILVIICVIIMIVILIGKVSAPKTIIEDYAKYGKYISIESTSGSLVSGESGDFSLISSTTGIYKGFTSANPELVKIAALIIGAILAVVIITSLPGMFGAKKDDKKKK